MYFVNTKDYIDNYMSYRLVMNLLRALAGDISLYPNECDTQFIIWMNTGDAKLTPRKRNFISEVYYSSFMSI